MENQQKSKSLQEWAEARTEIEQTYPRPQTFYHIDLKWPIKIEEGTGKDLLRLMDGRFLSVWRSQKTTIAQCINDEDMKSGRLAIVFEPVMDTQGRTRLIPKKYLAIKK